jgi:exonuclease SbcC
MRITKLRVKNFGKIRELAITFGLKLNVIYGANEAGKTTILSFIKAMLYGMNSRKRGLRENDRLRFQPWNGDFGEGELSFQDEKGREFLLRRKLKNDRRDNIYVSEVKTGRRLVDYETARPGEAILGLGEAAFTRTIYVPQLGCAVSADKEDEIMLRLMNLQQTGEEQVSLQKALAILDKERKKITLRSGNGKLDSLLSLQLDLCQEREMAQKLHEENIADQRELNQLREKRNQLRRIMVKLEEKKNYFKRRKQYWEYLELKKAAEALQILQEKVVEIEAQLLCGDSIVDAQFLQEVQYKITEWRHQDEIIKELEKEIGTKVRELENEEIILAKFQGFAALEENIGAQVLLKEQEKKSLTEKLAQLEKWQQDKADLEALLASKKAGLGSLMAFYELTPDEEEKIAEKEAMKQQLEERLKHDQQIDYLRREFITDKLKRVQKRVVFSVLAVVVGLIIGVLLHPLSYLFALFGVISGFYEFSQVRKHQATLAEIEAQLTADGNSDSLKKDLEAVQEELSTIYQRYGASDYQQFSDLRRKFECAQGEIGIIEAKLSDRTAHLADENGEAVHRQLKECQDYLQKTFMVTACNNLQDFNDKLAAFEEKKNEQANKKRDLKQLQSKVANLLPQRETLTQIIGEKLRLEFAGGEVWAQAEQLLQKYGRNLARKKEVAIRLEAETRNLQERLAGRSLTEIAALAEGFSFEEGELLGRDIAEAGELAERGRGEIKQNQEMCNQEKQSQLMQNEVKQNENQNEKVAVQTGEQAVVAWHEEEVKAVAQEVEEENLELRLKEYHEERLEVEKKLTGIESRIKSRFQDVREISRIEEELELVARQIKEYEEILEALDLTKTVLLEAFEELQNSFGPLLNNKVGHILREISCGKYDEVNVAENYRISLKDQTEWERELGFFSNGTLDQVYFALRLGIIDLAYDSGEKLPLILDDTFVQYDDERLAAVLNYLLAYAEQHQVLLFTCHRREAEILQGSEFTYLTLDS